MTIMWLIIVLLLVFIEVMTVNLTTIWYIISGLVALITSIFIDSLIIQFSIFVLLGTLLLITTRKTLLKILIYTLLMIITVVYTYKIRVLVDDELFNYGFAKNILDGLIPYKDFNMIIPPLFAYMTAFILKIFGKKLLIYHILTAFIIIGITYVSAKKIGKMSFIIYLLLLIYPYTGYNMFSLFLFFILLNFIILNQKSENKKIFYLEPIIISLIILTKHTLGLLVIPSLIYSKNRLKTFLIYIISFLILVLYLAINNNIFEFIDYTILGMFSFTNKNGTSINFLLIVEFLIIGYLIYKLKKPKSKE